MNRNSKAEPFLHTCAWLDVLPAALAPLLQCMHKPIVDARKSVSRHAIKWMKDSQLTNESEARAMRVPCACCRQRACALRVDRFVGRSKPASWLPRGYKAAHKRTAAGLPSPENGRSHTTRDPGTGTWNT